MASFFLRKRTAKGFGVHSPFAFSFITKVIYEKLPFYAYSDIPQLVSKLRVDSHEISEIHRLSFRLVNFFHAKNVLALDAENKMQILFVTAPSVDIRCTCISMERESAELLKARANQVLFYDSIPDEKFDAIFMNAGNGKRMLTVDKLIDHSHNETFWVIDNIHQSKDARHFWKEMKNDARVSLTFDMKRCGIVILNSSFHKLNYFI